MIGKVLSTYLRDLCIWFFFKWDKTMIPLDATLVLFVERANSNGSFTCCLP